MGDEEYVQNSCRLITCGLDFRAVFKVISKKCLQASRVASGFEVE